MSSMGDSHLLVDILTTHFGPAGGHMHTGVEVGVCRGELSAKLLKAFPGLMLWMVDEWAEYKKDHPYRLSGDSCAALTYDQQTENFKAAKLATDFVGWRRCILRLRSVEGAKRVPCPRLSWVFLDGSHVYEDVRDDIAAWWPRIESRGLLAGHDHGHKRFPGVAKAVNEFAEREGVAVNLNGSCWSCVKP